MQKLTINDCRLWIKIGCSEQERFLPTCISLSLEIEFLQGITATQTDDLSNTICYATLIKDIEAFCITMEFKLLEYLAGQIHAFIKQRTLFPVKITVTTTKVLPPVNNIHGGVSFIYSE